MALIDLANPTRFLALAERLLPWLAAATAVALANRVDVRSRLRVVLDFTSNYSGWIMAAEAPASAKARPSRCS